MPDKSILQTFPTPTDKTIVIEHVSDEFTSQCPITGHPDFATVLIRYAPAPAGSPQAHTGCVELKSLKLYYQAYRNKGIFYEAVTDKIRNDLAEVLHPVWLQVVTHWKGRGGIRSVIRAHHGEVPLEYSTRD